MEHRLCYIWPRIPVAPFGGLKTNWKERKGIPVDEEENVKQKKEKENNPMNKFESGVKIMRLLCFKLTGRRR